MVILGMFGTFLHCNQVLRTQVALKVCLLSEVELVRQDVIASPHCVEANTIPLKAQCVACIEALQIDAIMGRNKLGCHLHCTVCLPQNRRQVLVLFLVILFLAGNIYFVYYVFWDQRLHVW